MKCYMLTEKDFESLIDKIKIDPKFFGPGTEPTAEQREDADKIWRAYNYQIFTWISEVKK